MNREIINPTDEEMFEEEDNMAKEKDNINPSHYKDECSMECIESMIIAFGVEAVYGFCLCNAYKYLWRYKNKNGMEDINKALWYVNKGEWIYDNYADDPDVYFNYQSKEDIILLRDLCEKKLV